MREINEGNIPKPEDYGISKLEYWDIIEACQEHGLIKGAQFTRGGQGNPIVVAFLDNVKLTVKGMEYLDERSVAMQAYKGLKEIRDWLPF